MADLTPDTIRAYIENLRKKGDSISTIKRKLSSIERYAKWAQKQGLITIQNFEQLKEAIANLSNENKPRFTQNHLIKPQIKLAPEPGFYRYLGLTIILVFMAALGAGLYNQLFKKTITPFAYPSSFVKGSRALSFQGRLTDSIGNPIITATNVQFKLYNSSASGSSLYTTGTCSVAPDTDGIFSVLIGKDCGAEITSSVFTENANVYLGVTVGTDQEMTPRQQIANVGYAMNSETLQGMPPGTGLSNVPFINSSGALVLAASSPTLQSTSGTFTIEAQTLTITTPSGSNGDISIMPDGSGNVGIGTTNPISKLDVSGGAIRTNEQFITTVGTGTAPLLVSSTTVVTNLNADLLDGHDSSYFFSSDNIGGTTNYVAKFSSSGGLGDSTIYDNGNIGIGTTVPASLLDVNGKLNVLSGGNVGIGTTNPANGKLEVNGRIYTTDLTMTNGASSGYVLTSDSAGAATWTDVSSVAGPWTLVGSNLYPDAATYNVAIGSTEAGTAKLYVNGNIGVGTTAPAYTVDVDGNINVSTGSTYKIGGTDVLSSTTLGSSVATSSLTTVGALNSGSITSGFGSIDTGSDGITTTGTIGTVATTSFTGAGATFTSINNSGSYTQSGTSANTFTGTSTFSNATYSALFTGGNVGIGTTAPAYGLDVTGTGRVTGALTLGTQATTTAHAVRADRSLTFNSDTNVTITAGAQDLTADRTWTLGWSGQLDVARGGSGASTFTKGVLLSPGTTSAFTTVAGIDNYIPKWSSSYITATSSIWDDGNVGIGNTGPGTKLDVTGTGRFSSTLTASDGFTLTTGALNMTATSGALALSGLSTSSISTGSNAFTIASGGTSSWNNTSGDLTLSTITSGTLAVTSAGALNLTGAAASTWSVTSGGLTINSTSADLTLKNTTSGNIILSPVGNVGIGTTVPIYKVDIAGDLHTTTGAQFATTSGNVGVGTTSPSSLFAVGTTSQFQIDSSGNISTSGTTGLSFSGNGADITFAGTGLNQIITGVGNNLALMSGGNTGIGTTAPVTLFDINSLFNVASDGNVGIGNTNPTTGKLVVNGRTYTTDFTMTNGAAAGYALTSDISGNASWTDVSSVAGPWTLTGSNLYPDATTYNVAIGSTEAGSAKLYVNGNVGIGTTAPTQALDVNGNINISTGSTYKIGGTDVLSASTLGVGVTSSSLVQVGALNSGSITSGFGSIDTGDDNIVTTGTMGSAGNTTFTGSSTTLSATGTALTLSGAGTSIAFSGAGLAQVTTAASQHLSLMTGGNVGVGTTAPTSGKLQVSGRIYTTDFTMTNGAASGFYLMSDISGNASWVNIDETAGPWTVTGSNLYPDETTYNVAIGSTEAGTAKLYVNGNLGVGTTGPTEAVDVVGNINVSSVYKIGGSEVLSASTLGVGVTSSSLVSVGILNSGSIGTGFGAINVGDDSIVTTGTMGSAGATTFTGDNITLDAVGDAVTLSGAGANVNFTGAGLAQVKTAASQHLALVTGGNVGVGTTAPSSLFTVGASNQFGVSSTGAISTNFVGDALTMSGVGSNINFTGAGLARIITAASQHLAVMPGGNVGIGTTAPGFKLEVLGDVGPATDDSYDLGSTAKSWQDLYLSGSLCFDDADCADSTNGFSGPWTLNVNDLYADYESYNVGIGTTAGVGNAKLAVMNGNVGIGTTNPLSKLGVLGNAAIGATYGAFSAPSNGLLVEGNVGIGTTAPSQLLDVNGNINISTGSTYKIGGTDVLSATTLGVGVTSSSLVQVGALDSGSITSGFGSIDTGADDIITTGTMGSAGNTTFTGSSATLSATGTALTLSGAGTSIAFSGAGLAQVTTAASQHLALMTGGNVGVGTTAPSSLFAVGATSQFQVGSTGAISTNFVGDALTMSGVGANVNFTGAGLAQIKTAASQHLGIMPGGNVGIGTTAPGFKLEVLGDVGPATDDTYDLGSTAKSWQDIYLSGNLCFDDSDCANSTNAFSGPWSLNVNDLYADYEAYNVGIGTTTGAGTAKLAVMNGNVGIGTTNPSQLLDIAGASGNMTFSSATGPHQIITGGTTHLTLMAGGNLGIGTTAPTTLFDINSLFNVTSGGNVGIGNTNPTSKLVVNGRTYTTDFTMTNGAATGYYLTSDISGNASWVDISDTAGPWTVTGSNLYPDETTYNVAIGSTEAGTAKLYVNGNVGIGTTAPTQALDVVGSVNISTGSTYKIGGTDVLSATTLGVGVTSSSLVQVGALDSGSITSGFGSIDTGADDIITTGTMGSAGNTTFTGSTATLSATGTALTLSGAGTSIAFSGAGLAQVTTAAGQNLALMPGTTGNVGIGTTNPIYKIDITGNLRSTTDAYFATTSGNVGIGTTGPLSKLGILGNATIGGTYGAFSAPANGLLVEGNVGIGTTNTIAKLDVYGTAYVDEDFKVFDNSNGAHNTNNAHLAFDVVGTGAGSTQGITLGYNFQWGWRSYIEFMQKGGPTGKGIGLYTHSDAPNILLLPDATGNVGIGSTTPTALFVVGTGNQFKVGSTGAISTNFVGDALTMSGVGANINFTGAGLAQILTAASQHLTLMPGGNVGIGTTTPSTLFDINSLFNVASDGNVGIGNTNPTNGKLVVNGRTYTTDFTMTNGAASGYYLVSDISGNASWVDIDDTAGPWTLLDSNLYPDETTYNVAIGSTQAGTAKLYVNGNVGIGTTTPLFALDIAGSIRSTTGAYFATTSGNVGIGTTNAISLFDVNSLFNILSGGNVGIGTTAPGFKLEVLGDVGPATDDTYDLGSTTKSWQDLYLSGNLCFDDTDCAGSTNAFSGPWTLNVNDLYADYEAYNVGIGTTAGVGTAKLAVMNGNVGIGTTAPLSKLAVAGNTAIGAAYGALSAPTNGMIVEGNVGIGTTSPGSPLTVVGSSFPAFDTIRTTTETDTFNSGARLITQTNGDMSDNFGGGFVFGGTDNGVSNQLWAAVGGVRNGADNSGAFVVRTSNAGTFAEWLRVSNAGNVGIGSTNPTSKLTVGASNQFAVGSTGAISTNFVGDALTMSGVGANINFTGAGLAQIKTAAGQNLALMPGTTGNVGIGGTVPIYKLDISGNLRSTTDAYFATTSGNVGIGTTGPLSKLAVVGNAAIGAAYGLLSAPANGLLVEGNVGIGNSNPTALLQVGASASAPTLFAQTGGNVGIGTTAPGSKLEVRSADTIGATLMTLNTYATGYLDFIDRTSSATSANGINFKLGTDLQAYIRTYVNAGYPTDLNFGVAAGQNNASTVMTIKSTGNVGIGTTNPSLGKLQVSGRTYTTDFTMTSGAASGYVLQSDISGNASWVDVSSVAGPWTLTGSNLYPDETTYNVAIGSTEAGTAKLYVNGNVGIGTTAPGYSLDISGNLRTTTGALFATTSGNVGIGTTNALSKLAVNGGISAGTYVNTTAPSNGMIISGYIGIGTTNPADNLQIADTNPSLSLKEITASSTLIRFKNTDGISSGQIKYDTAGGNIFTISNRQDGPLVFTTGGDTEKVRIDSTGNLGIGSTNPTSMLTVGASNQFDVTSTGAISTNFVGDALTMSGVGTNINFTGAGLAQIITAASQHLGIMPGGNVGIGNTAPIYKVDISGDLRSTTGAQLATTSGNVGVGNTSATSLFTVGASNQFAVGSTGAISTNFVGDALTMSGIGSNINFTGAGLARIITAASQHLAVMPGGNVGIGTTAPGFKLEVLGDVGPATDDTYDLGSTTKSWQDLYLSGNLCFDDTDCAGSTNAFSGPWTLNVNDLYADYESYNVGIGTTAGVGTAKLAVMNGSVGIGTTAPGDPLTVVGTATDGIVYKNSDSGAYGQIVVKNDGNEKLYIGIAGSAITGQYANTGYLAAPASNDLALLAGGAEAMRLKDGGNVGIGNTNPTTGKLVVNGRTYTTDFTMTNGAAAGYYLTSDISGNASWVNIDETAGPWTLTGSNLYPDATTHNVAIGATVAGSAKLYINGNVGIGTTAPIYSLDIAGNLRSTTDAYFATTSGNVGIGTTAPKTKLGILGNVAIGGTYGTYLAPANGLAVEGNVGIGTTAPSGSPNIILQVEGNGPGLVLHDTGTGGGKMSLWAATASNAPALYFKDEDNNAIRMAIDIDNNYVGIGGDLTPDYTLELYDATTTPTLALTDDDIAHGVTTIAETDAFFHLSSLSTTVGGAYLQGLADADGTAFQIRGVQSSTPTDTTPAIKLIGAKASGTGVQDLDDAETILQIDNNDNAPSLSVLGNGNVGIGNTNPGSKLVVNGRTYTTDFTMTNGAAAGYALTSDISGNASWTDVSGVAGPWTLTGVNLYPDSTTYNVAIGSTEAGTAKLFVDGNVGIGTTAPISKLAVVGNTAIGAAYGLLSAPANGLLVQGNVGIGNSNPTALFQVGASASAPVIFAQSGGNVGIGTTAPTSGELQVNGRTYTTNFTMTNGGASGYTLTSDISGNATWTDVSSIAGPWTLVSNDLFPDATTYNVAIGATVAGSAKLYVNGNVGIGTTAPTAQLDITSSGVLDFGATTEKVDLNANYLRLTARGGATTSRSIWFGRRDNDYDYLWIDTDASIFTFRKGMEIVGNSNIYGTFTMSDNNIVLNDNWLSGDGGDEGVFVTSGGNVGVGSTNSTSLFTVGASNQFAVTSTGAISTNFVGDALTMSGVGANINFTGAGLARIITAASQHLAVMPGGNVGIGTTAPGFKLEVLGDVGPATDDAYDLGSTDKSWQDLYLSGNLCFDDSDCASSTNAFSGPWTLNVNDLYADYEAYNVGIGSTTGAGSAKLYVNGNVGIGTSAPVSTLAIAGNTAIGAAYGLLSAPANGLLVEGNVGIGTTNPTVKLDVAGSSELEADGYTVKFMSATTQLGHITYSSPALQWLTDFGEMDLGGAGAGTDLRLWAGGDEKARIDTAGNVGIGSTNPTSKLTVGASNQFAVTSTGAISTNFVGDALTMSGVGANINFTGAGLARIITAASQHLGIMPGGNVGIGNTAPIYKVDITGDLRTTTGAQFATTSGNVGIGTSAVFSNLDVITPLNGYIHFGRQIANGQWTGIGFGYREDNASYRNAAIVFEEKNTAGSAPGTIHVLNADKVTGQNLTDARLSITSTGNVGVGTTNPLSKLAVIGNTAIGATYGAFTAPTSGLIVEGNTGIGSTNPTSLFNVGTNNQFAVGSTGAISTNFVGDALTMSGVGANVNFTGAGLARIITAASQHLAVMPGGNVGIGTTAPGFKLEVLGDVGPGTDDTYDLGSTDKSWQDLYLSGNLCFDDTDCAGSTNDFSGPWTLNVNNLYPDYEAYNIGIGSTTGAGSAKLYVNGNVGIGTSAPVSKLAVAGNTAIGATYGLLSASANGLIVEGNVGIGNSNPTALLHVGASAVTPALFVQAGGNVGIGATNPTSAFMVAGATPRIDVGLGTSGAAVGLLQVNNYTAGMNRPIVLNPSTGEVSMAGALSVVGNSLTLKAHNGAAYAAAISILQTSLNVGVGSTTPSSLFNVGASNQFAVTSTGAISTNFVGDALTMSGIGANINFTGAGLAKIMTAASQHLALMPGGNVGIGTTAPAEKLDIVGKTLFRAGSGSDGSGTYNHNLRFGYDGTDQYQHYIRTRHNSTAANNAIDFYVSDGTAGGVFPTNAVHAMSLNAGNVGIGTTAPISKLAVVGNTAIGSTYGKFSAPSNGLMVQGSVGIGTTNPLAALDVVKTLGVGSSAYSNGDGYSSLIRITDPDNGKFEIATGAVIAQLVSQKVGDWALPEARVGTRSAHAFGIMSNNAVRMTFDTAGNVGIGTTAPGFKLEVLGDVGPATDDAYDLGSTAKSWQDIYLSGNVCFDDTDCASSTNDFSGPWTLNVNNLYPDYEAYNIGIGSTTGAGSAKLYVNGNVGIGTTAPIYALDVTGSIRSTTGAYFATTSGNVGIGTTAPTAIIGIEGTADRTIQMERVAAGGGAGNDLTIMAGGAGVGSTNAAGGNLYLSTGTSTGNVGTNMYFQLAAAAASGPADRAPATKMVLDSFGRLIINSASGGTYNLEAIGTGAGYKTIARIRNNATAANGNGAQFLFADNISGGTMTDAAAVTGVITDITLGAYKGALAFLTANNASPTEVGRFDNLGNLGVGTTNPIYKVDISGDLRTTTGAYFATTSGNVGIGTTNTISLFDINQKFNVLSGGNVGVGNTNPGALFVVGASASTPTLFAQTGGNVGIGTTNPTYKLDINGTTRLTSITDNSAAPASGGFINIAHNTYTLLGMNNAGGSSRELLSWGKAGTDIFRIAGDGNITTIGGNVGIGTTVATYNLNVNGSINADEYYVGGVLMGTFTAGTVVGQTLYWDGATYSPSSNLFNNDTNVGIGTTNPLALFQVGNSPTPTLFAQAGGNVGIGTTAPTGLLHVVSTAGASYKFTTAQVTLQTDNSTGPDVIISSGSTGELNFPTDGVVSSGSGLYFRNGASAYTRVDQGKGFLVTAGNLGVGSTSPTSLLNVGTSNQFAVGSTGAISTNFVGDALTMSGVGANINFTGAGLAQILTAASQNLALMPGGNVGIGTSAPLSKLAVAGNAAIGAAYGLLSAPANGLIVEGNVGVGNTNPTALFQVGASASSPTLFAQSGGNVGIGTTDPGAPLTFANTVAEKIRLYSTSYGLGISAGTLDLWADTQVKFRDDSSSGTVNAQIAVASGTATYFNAGNVGIGTTDPGTILHIKQAVDTASGGLRLADAGGTTTLNLFVNADKGLIYAGATGQKNLILNDTGNVGIGTTNPTTKLYVSGGDITANRFCDTAESTPCTTYLIDPAAAGTSININGDIALTGGGTIKGGSDPNVAITINSGTQTITLNGGSTGPTATSVCVDVYSLGTCTGKLDAGTVDPPYTINGRKYATYLTSMIGIKEETTGTIATSQYVTDTGYQYIVDFNNLEEGSDLWLFSKTTNLKKNIGKLVALLTPAENTRVWYKVDKDSHKLTIYSSRPTTISYRLTAPRFDYEMWANTREGGGTGFIIDDPDTLNMAVNNQGDITAPTYTVEKTNSEPRTMNYELKDQLGEIIEETMALSKATIANLTAGFINATDATIARLIVNEKIISPVIETQDIVATGTAKLNNIETNQINPTDKDIVINLASTPVIPTEAEGSLDYARDDNNINKGALAKLIIKGIAGQTVASIDAAGNASFSGQLAAGSLDVTGDATISGQLTAQEIQSEKLKVQNLDGQEATISGTLTAQRVDAENINSLESNVESLSTDINDVQALLAQLRNEPLPDAQYYQNLDPSTATDSALIADSSTTQNAERTTFSDLTVTANTNLYTVTIADSLLAGMILVKDNSILAVASELKLSALESINLLEGAVVIAKDGTITTKGALIAQGGVKTNTIQAVNSGDDVNVILGKRDSSTSVGMTSDETQNSSSVIPSAAEGSLNNSKLAIKNNLGNEVASIDASGSARFNSLSLNKYMDATSSAAIIAAPDNFEKNGLYAPAIETKLETAGLGIVPQNSTEVVIYNDNIKESSLVYLTPTTSSPANNLTVIEKHTCSDLTTQDSSLTTCKPYFKVAIPTATPAPINFNWLIIN